MFFFFFDEALSNNSIIQEAFEYICFQKLVAEGYCDLNPVFGKPNIRKEELAYHLEALHSPLASLFRQPYPKDMEEVKQRLLPVLDKMAEEQTPLSDYTLFAILYYIYRVFPTYEKRADITQQMFEGWNDYLYNSRNQNLYTDFDLRISGGIVFDENTVDLRVVNTISTYISLLDEMNTPDEKVFFRGHRDISYQLVPSIFRKDEWLHNEKKMYQELQIHCPDEFSGMSSHLEILAEMQHYGLPTRLLDITQNPLIALYFACENAGAYMGEVILFSVKKTEIKYPQSDTVAVLTSLPLFTYQEQKAFFNDSKDATLSLQTFNQKIARLVQEVRAERPGFKAEILPTDLRKNVVVIPSKNNRRLDRQEGAFIVCGLLEEVYGPMTDNSIHKLRAVNKDGKKVVCVISKKETLLKQLNSLGIHKARIYPEIDDVADYLKNHIEEI